MERGHPVRQRRRRSVPRYQKESPPDQRGFRKHILDALVRAALPQHIAVSLWLTVAWAWFLEAMPPDRSGGGASRNMASAGKAEPFRNVRRHSRN
jgi:hypothetical protein